MQTTKLAWLALPVLLATSSGAFADQTASETVAYLLYQAEDGASGYFGGPYKEVAPASYEEKYQQDGKDYIHTIKIEQIDGCNYKIKTFNNRDSNPKMQSEKWVANFEKVRPEDSHGPGPYHSITYRGAALCWDGDDGSCNDTDRFPLHVSGLSGSALLREHKAFDYFKANFCKGQAF